MLGHRGSTDEGWTWSRPPRQPPRFRALAALAVAGAVVVAALGGLVVVVFLLLDDGPAGGTTPTPTPEATVAAATATAAATPTATVAPAPTATATAAATPTATVAPATTATATPEPTPTATPLPTSTLTAGGSTFSLAVWDGERWWSKPPLSLSFGEGDAVPFLLRIENAKVESEYSLTLRHDCEALGSITSYDQEAGVTPALAGAGPGSPRPDSFAAAPGFSLWGGLFTAIGEPQHAGGCEDEGRLEVSLRALRDDVFLLWGAALSDGAASLANPFQMTLEVAEAGEVFLWLSPTAVEPAQ